MAYSNILDKIGNKEIGRWFDSSAEWADLGIGIILATLKSLGNFPVDNDLLKRTVRGAAINGAAIAWGAIHLGHQPLNNPDNLIPF